MARNNNDWIQMLELPLKVMALESEDTLRRMQTQKLAEEGEARKKFNDWLTKQFPGGVGNQAPNGIGLTGFNIGSDGQPTLNFGQTPESKISEQSKIAQAKENETAIGKAERLATVGQTIGTQWLKTSPYKGAITKTGLVPALGMWDIIKKGAGATDAQRRDQVYASFISGVRAQLARGMGDVGNLSEYEQRAVIQLVPNLMDSYESGQLKLGQLAQLVEDIKTTRSGKQGKEMQTFNVGGETYNIPKDKVEAFKKAKGLK
jgi:hypothetical protein